MNPTLNDAHRAWLRNAMTATMPMRDGVLLFISLFKLTPEEAGFLLSEWIKETT